MLPFGLEGDTLKNALMMGNYCKAGLAMFPEIVGPVCIEAAIKAYNRKSLPSAMVTPYAVLTAENLPDLYTRQRRCWQIRRDAVDHRLSDPARYPPRTARQVGLKLPRRIGFVIPFSEHEWYKKLVRA